MTPPHSRRSALCALGLLVLVASPASASPMSFSENIHFEVNGKSIWGPGGDAGDFGAGNGDPGGALGIRYDVGASSGSVSADFRGNLNAGYDDLLAAPGQSAVSVGWGGQSGGASFSTSLGAWIDVEGYLDVGFGIPEVDVCLICTGYNLSTSKSASSSFDISFSDSDAETLAGVGPSLIVAGLSADADIDQTARLRVTGMDGEVHYRNRDSGISRSEIFALTDATADEILLDLDETGTWDVWFEALTLTSSFLTDFDLDLVARAWFDVGIADGEFPVNLAGFDLFSTSFDLGFGQENSAGGFSIVVVPEPGTATLFACGCLGLALVGRRRPEPA